MSSQGISASTGVMCALSNVLVKTLLLHRGPLETRHTRVAESGDKLITNSQDGRRQKL